MAIAGSIALSGVVVQTVKERLQDLKILEALKVAFLHRDSWLGRHARIVGIQVLRKQIARLETTSEVSKLRRLDHGGKAGCILRSSPDTEHYAWPPRIGEVEPDVVALWRDVAGLVEHPAAIARFHDLLFERRDGRRDEHAAAAAQG